ncbi:MAG: DUF4124 domain-containing protein [Gammaproteobacteria bacterium]|nr:DUF4124 domain-containing protein [Gammaproteobacteria bacterium]
MDWSLIIFLIVILIFGYRGYRKGLFKSLGRILSVLAGYICAILYTGQASRLLESQFQLQGIVAFLGATLLLFFGASLLVGLLFWLLQKLLLEDATVSIASSLGGGVVGLATGTLLAIVIVWCFTFVRDSRPVETLATTASNPSGIEQLANRVAGKAVASAMSLSSTSPEVAKISAAVAAAPADMVQRAQRLANSEDMAALLNDPRNQALLDSGDHEALRKLPAFQQLIKNPDLQALASATGLLDDATRNNQALDAEVAIQLTDVWGRAQRVKNIPRVQEIIGDAEFQQKLRSGNPLDLLTNDKLLELANIIFAEPASESEGASTSQQTGKAGQPETGKKMYSWTDDSGRVHYSDTEPAALQ